MHLINETNIFKTSLKDSIKIFKDLLNFCKNLLKSLINVQLGNFQLGMKSGALGVMTTWCYSHLPHF